MKLMLFFVFIVVLVALPLGAVAQSQQTADPKVVAQGDASVKTPNDLKSGPRMLSGEEIRQLLSGKKVWYRYKSRQDLTVWLNEPNAFKVEATSTRGAGYFRGAGTWGIQGDELCLVYDTSKSDGNVRWNNVCPKVEDLGADKDEKKRYRFHFVGEQPQPIEITKQ